MKHDQRQLLTFINGGRRGNFRLNGQRCYLLIKEERMGRRHCEPYGIGQSIIQWALYMLLQIFQNMLTAEMVHGSFCLEKCPRSVAAQHGL